MIAMFLAAGIVDQARETGEQFGWNPWLFLSQVISFVIVALVLRAFAYKPILAVLQQRRQQIADARRSDRADRGAGSFPRPQHRCCPEGPRRETGRNTQSHRGEAKNRLNAI